MPPATSELTRLAALDALEVLDTPAEERFDRVTRLALRLFGVEGASVNLVDRDRQWTKSTAGGPRLADLDRDTSICATAIQTPDLLAVADLSQDARFADNPLVTGDPHLRFYAGQPLEVAGGQRVGTLCLYDSRPRALSPADASLLQDLALWVQKELALDEELARAADVQRGLLPTSAPELPGWDVLGTCRPAREVGGDLYDWYPVAGGLALTVADVMGKGMPAAIMMATLRAVLRAASRRGDVAGAVAFGADSMIADFGDTGAFATLIHGVLRPDQGALTYVDAGHGLGLVVRADGSAERLAGTGLPAGAVEGTTWTAQEAVLAPGDALVLFSDGLLDLHADREAVEVQVIEAVTGATTSADVVEHLTWATQGLKVPDDVTVLVVRRTA